MRIMVIEIKHYQLKNLLIKLEHTWMTSYILEKYGTWEKQLTITINFISSKDTDERRVTYWVITQE